MFFKYVLLFVATAAAHPGWTVPAGQPNGVYSVSVSSSGIETHTLLQANDAAIIPSAKMHRKRDLTGPQSVGCGNYPLNHGDTDSANGALDAQCGDGAFVHGGLDFYSIAGGTVAYFCNFSGWTNNCYASERQRASGIITNDCGLYNAGWDYVQDRAGQYGYEARGSRFCGRGV